MTTLRTLTKLTHPSKFATQRTFTTTSPRSQTIPFSIHASGSGVAQTISVANSSHKITTDASPALGGKDVSPSPLHYNFTSLSSCTQVTGSLVAKDLGIELGKWDVSVSGLLDPSVLVGGKEGNANLKAVRLEVKVESSAGGAERVGREVERRCPVTQLFKRSGVEWSSEW